MKSNKSRRKNTEITFLTNQTNPSMEVAGTGPMCLILWIPRDKWDAMVNERKKERDKE